MTLDLSTNTFINLSDEIDYITTYLKVEKTRLENQFDYSINIDKTLNLHEIHLPRYFCNLMLKIPYGTVLNTKKKIKE
jgi:LytS/YehU family sensor histidine kinase